MRATFVKNLKKEAQSKKDIFLLTGDLGKFFGEFQTEFPNRFINCGLAEENMVGVAAGLALSGKNVYCYSIAPFLTMRAFEQIRVDVCLHNLNVKFLGAGGGLVYGLEGMTHQTVEDIAVMRALPNMSVVAPADLFEAKALAQASINYPGPIYIRFGQDNPPAIHRSLPKLKIGKGIVLKRGKDIAIIATGSIVYQAKLAAEILAEKGMKVTLVSMPTIKPIDKKLLNELAKTHEIIFTIEDHLESGGLGTAVLEALDNFKGSIIRIGLPEKLLSNIGGMDYLYKLYGLDADSISKKILKECKKN